MEPMHHVAPTSVNRGILVLVSNIIVNIALFLLLEQLSEVWFVLVQLTVPLGADPLQLGVWLYSVGVKVFIESVVLTESSPMPSVWGILVKNDTVVLLVGQQIINVLQVPQFRVLDDLHIVPQNLCYVCV
jgi:hypothetical protein